MFEKLFRRQQAPEQLSPRDRVVASEAYQLLKAEIDRFGEQLDVLLRRLNEASPDATTMLTDVPPDGCD